MAINQYILTHISHSLYCTFQVSHSVHAVHLAAIQTDTRALTCHADARVYRHVHTSHCIALSMFFFVGISCAPSSISTRIREGLSSNPYTPTAQLPQLSTHAVCLFHVHNLPHAAQKSCTSRRPLFFLTFLVFVGSDSLQQKRHFIKTKQHFQASLALSSHMSRFQPFNSAFHADGSHFFLKTKNQGPQEEAHTSSLAFSSPCAHCVRVHLPTEHLSSELDSIASWHLHGICTCKHVCENLFLCRHLLLHVLSRTASL